LVDVHVELVYINEGNRQLQKILKERLE